MRALWLRRVESSVRIKNIMGYVSIADRRTLVSIWSQDRKRSQAEDRTWFYLLRSSAIRIADDRRSVFPYDRRRSQNFLRSAIFCDHMETILKQRRMLRWCVTRPLLIGLKEGPLFLFCFFFFLFREKSAAKNKPFETVLGQDHHSKNGWFKSTSKLPI